MIGLQDPFQMHDMRDAKYDDLDPRNAQSQPIIAYEASEYHLKNANAINLFVCFDEVSVA